MFRFRPCPVRQESLAPDRSPRLAAPVQLSREEYPCRLWASCIVRWPGRDCFLAPAQLRQTWKDKFFHREPAGPCAENSRDWEQQHAARGTERLDRHEAKERLARS